MTMTRDKIERMRADMQGVGDHCAWAFRVADLRPLLALAERALEPQGQALPIADEEAAFENWCINGRHHEGGYKLDKTPGGAYINAETRVAFWGWLARAYASQFALPAGTFQQRVRPWMMACFGETISNDLVERNHRFLEEALELVQSTGCTQSEAHQLVDYVFGRPVGEPAQEVGGVMVTLAALCLAAKVDMHAAGETELDRIWTKVDQIRAKQAAKPKHSPLPVALPAGPGIEQAAQEVERACQFYERQGQQQAANALRLAAIDIRALKHGEGQA